MTIALAVDPVKLAEFVFGHSHWAMTEEVIRAIFKTPNARVAVKGCHASGKTFAAADIIPMALLLGHDAITTAPTDDQVRGVLWQQVGRALQDSQIPLSEWGNVTQKSIELPTGEFAMGRSTDQGVRFQGYHARPKSALIIIVDEAPGVIEAVLEAVEGISAGGDVRLLLLGNPVISSGPFFDIFATDAPGWRRFTIDAFDTPNLAGLTIEALLTLPEHELDNNPRPYLVTRRWVRDRYVQWGPDHPLYQSRVRGQFPLQADDALISLAWCEQARLRETAYDPKRGPLAAGVDVAGPGEDETAAWIVQHGAILDEAAFSQADARGEVLAFLKPWLHQGLVKVNVDSAGMGYYFAQHLCDMLPESVTVNAINVGERPTSDKAAELFVNLKAELYWGLRERFREGAVSGLTDQTTIAQLAAIRYEHDSRGRVVIETKEKARKRGVRSPDRAEALMLAYAPDDPSEMIAKAYAASTTKPNDREAFFAARRARHRERGRA